MFHLTDISVSLFRPTGSKILYMQYSDPVTGGKVRRTTGHVKRSEAAKVAGKWEEEINSGRDQRRGRIAWDEFRRRYEDEVMKGLAPATDKRSPVCSTRWKKSSIRRSWRRSMLTRLASIKRRCGKWGGRKTPSKGIWLICGSIRLMATSLEKSPSPGSSPRKISAMPPSASALLNT